MRIVYNPTIARLGFVALTAAGCGLETIGPGNTSIPIALDFCSSDTPIWFAHQNLNGPFEVITPDASGTFHFDASDRGTIAFVRQSGSNYKTDFIYASNLDLEVVSGLTCVEEIGTKSVNGTVGGLGGTEIGLVGMGFSSVFLPQGQTSFTLTQLVDRPLDLVASRVDVNGTVQHANKTIIRRAQNPVNGATLTPLNFVTDGFEPTGLTATVNGVGGDAAFLNNTFFSQLETSHTLSFVDGIVSGLTGFGAIPTAQLAAGDYHDLFAIATSLNASRGVERFFRNPVDQSMTLGPALLQPAVTVITSTPTVRMRTELLAQFDYTTTVNSLFTQQTSFNTTQVELTVNASYFGGTPQTWNLPMPDLSSLPGWQNSWGLQSPGTIDWTVTAYFGRPALLLGAKPNDLETVVFASFSSSTAAAQMFRANRGSPRPRHFGRLR